MRSQVLVARTDMRSAVADARIAIDHASERFLTQLTQALSEAPMDNKQLPPSAEGNGSVPHEPQMRRAPAGAPPEHVAPPVRIDGVEAETSLVDDIIRQYVRQSTAVAAQKRKTALAMNLVRDLHKTGYINRQETFLFLDALDDSVQLESEAQRLYDRSTREQLMMELQHMNQLLQLGVRNIAAHVGESVDGASVLLSRRGGRGFVASLLVGAKVGIGPTGPSRDPDIVEGGSSSSRGRFDGVIIGDSDFDDEFGGLE